MHSVYNTIGAESLNKRHLTSHPYRAEVHILHCVLTKVTKLEFREARRFVICADQIVL